MIRVAALGCALALAACAVKQMAAQWSVPADLRECPASVSVPASLPKIRTPAQIGQYATDVELAREAERARGDDCADKLSRLNAWIGKNR